MHRDDLAAMDLADLERTYRDAPFGPLPGGLWTGRALAQLDARAWVRALDWVMFRLPAFGIDFDARAWWFVRPTLRVGRFTARRAPSRWRDTETLRIEYDVSRLPGRRLLYDEVKPLGPDLCICIGGVNAERGRGEHFYFVLARGDLSLPWAHLPRRE